MTRMLTKILIIQELDTSISQIMEQRICFVCFHVKILIVLFQNIANRSITLETEDPTVCVHPAKP